MSDAGEATKWGALLASLLMAAGALYTTWANRRGLRESTTEQARQYNLTTLIDTMQEEMATMRAELKAVKAENRECLADRDQMRGEIRRLTRRLEGLEHTQGGC